MSSTRRGLILSTLAAGAAPVLPAAPAEAPAAAIVPLCGAWRFRAGSGAWQTVEVPHTWQTAAATAEHFGDGFYERTFHAPESWRGAWVRIEFEAVFHSAWVTLNGQPVGEHVGKGYTAFCLDLTPKLRFGAENRLEVRVSNDFNEHMLPRGHSSDWTHDGGIYRPVQLLVTPLVFIEGVEIDSVPDLSAGSAEVRVRARLRNSGDRAAEGPLDGVVSLEGAGSTAPLTTSAARYRLAAGERATVALPPLRLNNAALWHFDHPNLYRLSLQTGTGHAVTETFGIRSIETRDGGFYLNGERVRLMGVERMAGSNPEFGMVEPEAWIVHDHDDMRALNCVYTRVHWMQDRRLLDYCDRHGILIQTEVPTWGPDTFKGMAQQPDADILSNGLEQLREMIARDRNHPCVFSWGVCNEINGQNPPAAAFARALYREAKRLDPLRLVSYASNSLQKTAGRDVAAEMDYIMWNEYYESWYAGTPADLARNLDEIHAAFPGKAVVISEYGWCACTPERPEGDRKRVDVLRSHDAVFRERPWVAGLIFFCYNDYRTHIGDQGAGVMKQRVHGVVDLYGNRKPSYEVLRAESSPIESLHAAGTPAALSVSVRTRTAVPSYTLSGYTLRAVGLNTAGTPVERLSAPLPLLRPGSSHSETFKFSLKTIARVAVDVLRPDGVSTLTSDWQY